MHPQLIQVIRPQKLYLCLTLNKIYKVYAYDDFTGSVIVIADNGLTSGIRVCDYKIINSQLAELLYLE
jgi:hypothetical protein